MRVLTLTLAVLATVLVDPAPAQAVSYVNVNAADVVVPRNACRTTTISVDGDWAGATNEITIDVYDPDGYEVWTDWTGDDQAAAGSATFNYEACTGDTAGLYSVEASVVEYDELGNATGSTSSWDEFRVAHQAVKKKSARLTMKKRAIRRGQFRTQVVSDLEVLKAPPHYDRGKKVHLLAYAGEWYIIDTARTNRKGKVGWNFKRNSYRWAMCSAPTAKVKVACTRIFRTRGFQGRSTVVPGPALDVDAWRTGPSDTAAVVGRR